MEISPEYTFFSILEILNEGKRGGGAKMDSCVFGP